MASGKKIGFELLLVLAIIARPLIKWLLPGLPSIEPIIPLAVLACILYGPGKGAMVGAGGYIGSNILLASIGPWVVPQAIAGIIAGFLPSILKQEKANSTSLVWLCILGTVIFELTLNIWGGGFEISYFMDSITFGFAHIVGNVFFAAILSGMLPSEKKEEKKPA